MKRYHQALELTLFAMIFTSLITTNQTLGANYTVIDLGGAGSVGMPTGAYGTNGTQQVGYGHDTGLAWNGIFVNRALLWNGSTGSGVSLHPTGYYESAATGISGTQQVGWGRTQYLHSESALLWNGSAESYMSLHPTGFGTSIAYATNGTQQVGYAAVFGSGTHALLWNGSANNYTDLTPAGFDNAVAYGISGTQQVGAAGDGTAGWGAPSLSRAILWNGTAEGYIDLTPDGFETAIANGISGAQQVGSGAQAGGLHHALLWNGSADSFVDLHPVGFDVSFANDTNGTQQVGQGWIADNYHAMLWNGSADSYIDLHQFLPAGYISSGATGIDQYGNIVGWATDSLNGNHAILWEPIPEPATLSLLALGAFLAGRKRRK